MPTSASAMYRVYRVMSVERPAVDPAFQADPHRADPLQLLDHPRREPVVGHVSYRDAQSQYETEADDKIEGEPKDPDERQQQHGSHVAEDKEADSLGKQKGLEYRTSKNGGQAEADDGGLAVGTVG